MNTKYSLGGAFGVSNTEGFIVSGSEDGNLVFWDVKTKDVVQKVGGHEGVVCWVDTSPQPNGPVVSGGLDGTVRIWVDVNGDDDEVGGVNGLKLEPEDGENVKMGNGAGFDDTPRDDASADGRSPSRMEED